MEVFMHYLILGIFVFGLNVIPVFAPPTWTVLTFYFLKLHLSLLPVVIIGAIAATLGRIVLYILSKNYFGNLLPKKYLDNMHILGKFIESHEDLTVPVVLTYAFLPISSNQMFVAAGLSGLPIRLIAFSFLIGRLISYTFWITASHRIVDSLETAFSSHYSNAGALVGQVLGFVVIVLLGKINWKKYLKIKS
ncbi:hypothetical protein HY029_00205 [Candidatus Gottesmanbacteria bacterium]|nr:hypothetical protein [Candidatus Gottesmanbacteria bacterium]